MEDFDKEYIVGWKKVHPLTLIFMSNNWELLGCLVFSTCKLIKLQCRLLKLAIHGNGVSLGVCCMAKEDYLCLMNLPLPGNMHQK